MKRGKIKARQDSGNPVKIDIPESVDSDSSTRCQICEGIGTLDIMTEVEGVEISTGETERCDWCQGTGIEPDVDAIEIRPEQVTEDDIKAIEIACCATRNHWSIIPAKVIAAATNHMMSVLPGRAMEGRRPD